MEENEYFRINIAQGVLLNLVPSTVRSVHKKHNELVHDGKKEKGGKKRREKKRERRGSERER